MTEMLSKEFSRKSFLKGGGALIVGFSAVGATAAGKASAAIDPYASPGPADPNAVDSFLIIHADNTASLNSGRIELGQGSTTGLRMIAAEELDMEVNQLRHISFDTGGVTPSPNTGNTGGSTSISQGGPLVRRAAAEAKQALLAMAATNLGVPVASLTVAKGVVSGGGKTVTYGQLVGDKLFNVKFSTTTLNAGAAPGKPVANYSIVGKARPERDDIPSIVDGSHTYAVNVRIPNMWHGRLVRPRGQGAYGDGTNPVAVKIDESSIKHLNGVRIIHVGNVLGVVAQKEYDAIQAAAQLKVQWSDPPVLSGSGNLWKWMREQDTAGKAPARIAAQSGTNASLDAAMKSAAQTYSGTWTYHYQMHAPIGPNLAIADVTKDSAIIYTHVKNGYGNTRPQVAAALSTAAAPKVYDPTRVRVIYYEGSSSFGGGAQHVDVGEAAAILSYGAGVPVRLQLMRWDEHGWDNYGPATMWDVAGGVDASGKIVAFDATSYGMGAYNKTPTESQVGQPMTQPGNGPADTTYSGTQYTIANRRIVGKTTPTLNNAFKTSTLRAPNAMQTCFANEQVIDQLAYLAGMDPYDFRLKNISTADQGQWRDSLVGVAQAANWKPRVAFTVKQTGDVRKGRGIALGGFAGSQSGIVAEIEVNVKSGKIVAKHMYASQVAGLTVGPSLVENQMSGALIMGVSRALHEAVAFDTGRVTSLDWVTYPLLRIKDAPKVTTVPIQRLDLQATGSGEPPTAASAAAIANAFFDATGVRLHKAPMTADSVRAELAAAGFKA